MALNFSQVPILNGQATEERGENARLSTSIGAIAISDLMKTTLGPMGMDKILQSVQHRNEVQVTNDGATILRSLAVDNPAAKVLIEISKAQDDEVGDGTTSVCVLAGEFLRAAEDLIAQHIHPQLIIAGWRKARTIALAKLEEIAEDHSDDEEKFYADLINIACTTLSSKIVFSDKEHFAKLCVDAVMRLKGSGNLDAIHLIKKTGGSLSDSYLDEGFILEKRIGVGCPKRFENPKILIANTPMDTDKIKIYGAKVKVDSVAAVADIEEAEKARMRVKAKKIADHGIDCFINRQLIYNLPEEYFASRGIMAIEHADFEGIERLALVLGGDIMSTFDDPTQAKLGTCKLIEEVMIGEDKVIKFSGVPLGEACTIVLRGSSQTILEEAERSLHDALCVISQTVLNKRIVYGGGCTEYEMANAVMKAAMETPGKEAIALEAYAKSLCQIPVILADNAGFDSAELSSRLRAAHSNGDKLAGIDVLTGKPGNMKELGITESHKVKYQIIVSATEAAEEILRVNDIIRCAPRQREQDPRYG
mmetsp:Transcript_16911/g.18868  ORF Transcript_16911/g.18868 Transcript_16911/m.18868 type:complete len:535 (+) Transcript_16911:109-1713(+)|eukprot:CAMPEP_0205826490 /NCGR_PEP_ID=MMETSP0206-20130828/28816_1 /ASSEMBLY_ACC=CAM_ASM_000279 /TAXON_ID=36767 /ORGANISM="Euplotes focardii, Strain TN1" /LENGTH=534 /DNA_ID=CAMNT_0053126465 /DNA_START=108 /DNA_END=1712 /DNA_ORIENTATION=+